MLIFRPDMRKASAVQAVSRVENHKVIDLLIDAGADVNAPGAKQGETALWVASSGGHSRVVDV